MSPGEQLIDILFITDIVAGFKHLAMLLSAGEDLEAEYVLSSGRQIPLKELASIYQDVSGCALKIEWGGLPYRKREVMKPWKGTILKGWSAKVSLEEGIVLFNG
jgi:nucleoside-diphosphate-sugar epimerase